MTTYPTRSLGEVAKLLSGGTPRKNNEALWRGDVPWLTPKDMGQWTGTTDQTVATSAIGNGTRLAPAGASFVAVRGMSLHNEIRIVRSDVPLTFNQDVKAIVANEGINPKFLYYALVAQRSQLLEWVSSAGHGTGVLETDRLKSVQVPEISWSQQTELAETLSSLDDKIELNWRMNKTLEAMAQAIFRDWFVEFGPTRRKLEGATDPVTILGGIVTDPTRAQELADLFPATLGDDGLPEGWRETPIGSLTEVVGGSTPSTAESAFWVGGAHLWATPKDLSKLAGLHLFDTERRVTAQGLSKIGSGLSPEGSVLLSSRAPIGYLAITTAPTAVNQGFIAIRPSRELPTAYALCWCKENMELVKANANGSTFQEISKGNFRPLPVIGGGIELRTAFADLAQPLLDLCRLRSDESRSLASTRDLLLPKLMSGQIRIGEVVDMAEAAQ